MNERSKPVQLVTTGTGQPTPVSGKYEQIDADGDGTGIYRFLTEGQPTPTGTAGVAVFRLIQPIVAVHTSAASAVAIEEGIELFDTALRNLAMR